MTAEKLFPQRSVIVQLIAVMMLFLSQPIVAGDLNLPSLHHYSLENTDKLIGVPRYHVIQKEDTLLDIARRYGLGFNEIDDLYPEWDPWLPPPGNTMEIPSQWILPNVLKGAIIVNIAELRLYYFPKKGTTVHTFPVGVGEKKWFTPEGAFTVSEKVINPTWTVPPSLQNKYAIRTLPPGPENPLGKIWLGLGSSRYGIHGTNFAWSIGRLVTRGCIRLYPEDIQALSAMIYVGTPVKIIYTPIKITVSSNRVLIEIHKDIYNRIDNFSGYGHQLLQEFGMLDNVDLEKLDQALTNRNGKVVDISPTTF